jgi:hypothetical protein
VEDQLKGLWIVELEGSIRSLRIARVEKASNGDVSIEATWMSAPAKVSFNGSVSPAKLEIATRAGTVISMSQASDGTFSGTFTPRTGPPGPAVATRLAPSRSQAGVAQCGLSEGVWDGTWSQGNFGTNTLWVRDVSSDCKALIRYGGVTESVTLKSGEFSFGCNPSTGGTCTFKLNGRDLWGSYSNPGGGRNNGVFKPVE